MLRPIPTPPPPPGTSEASSSLGPTPRRRPDGRTVGTPRRDTGRRRAPTTSPTSRRRHALRKTQWRPLDAVVWDHRRRPPPGSTGQLGSPQDLHRGEELVQVDVKD